MPAGGSQAVQAVRSALDAVWVGKQRDRRSARHRAGCKGERAVCAALSRLATQGYHHLDDLRWRADPESKANLDHLVVGPSGVFVVDAKNWAGRVEVRGTNAFHNGVPCDDRLIALGWLTHRVEEVLLAAGIAVRPQPVVCFATPQPALPPALGRALLTDVDCVGTLLTKRPTVLSANDVSLIIDLLAYAFPPYDVDPREAAEAAGLLFGDDETRHAGLEEALRRPIEEWMVWLHSEQASTARRTFAGPARVGGPAGTGKTCVALHRCAWLASTRPGRFLVTSLVKTLPTSLEAAYRRLAPATADRVDFLHVHGVALRLLAERGVKPTVNSGDTAFCVAWARHRDALRATGLHMSYFKEEVGAVIKGRDLPSVEDYLVLSRVGRRTPLRADVRREVWALKDDYDMELRRRGQVDFVDVLRVARDEARREPFQHWTGVFVDEVQDVPMVGLQLLHELAGRDRPDGLLLVGDGQQAIYPGGFRLSEAGISVAGRSVSLKVNYRNTVEVLATARAVVVGDAYEDLDSSPDAGDRDVEVVRHGELPTVGAFETVEDHDAALVWDVRSFDGRGVEWRDVAVLCQTNDEAKRYASLLDRAGVPAVLLASEPAPSEDGVRVGTWFRSKGMEFSHVFLPQVDRPTRLLTGAGPSAELEKAELLRRTLYVAMTRARDTLWVGRIAATTETE
jgi:hypothetical protein